MTSEQLSDQIEELCSCHVHAWVSRINWSTRWRFYTRRFTWYCGIIKEGRFTMKKLLLAITMLSLVGCGEASAEDLPLWHDNLTLVKKFDRSGGIWMSSKGNCYLLYNNYNRGSVSKVDCEDFNVKADNHLTKESSTATDSSTALLEYIRDYCVVNDEYKDFPRVAGTSVIEELQGKQLSCKLPDSIDSSLNERAEYLRLKKKFGG